MPKNFLVHVGFGDIENYKTTAVLSTKSNIGTIEKDMWQGVPNRLTYPTTQATLNISSSSASDTSGGIGLERIQIDGLNEALEPVSEKVTLNGTTTVTTTTEFFRVQSAQALKSGAPDSENVAIGNIRMTHNGTGSEISQIVAGRAQSLNSFWTCPSGKEALVLGIDTNSDSQRTIFQFLYRQIDDDGLTPWLVYFEEKGEEPLQRDFKVPFIKLNEGEEIRATAKNDTGSPALGQANVYLLVRDKP